MKILVVVDYQNDFVDGALANPEAKKLDDGISLKMQEYLDSDNLVMVTFDSHKNNYMDTVEGKNLPIMHCELGSKGWELYGKTYEVAKNNCHKQNYIPIIKSTFGSATLFQLLKKIPEVSNIKEEDITIEFCGVVTDMCVFSNVVLAKSALPNAQIRVLSNLCAGTSKEMHEMALKMLKNIHIKII